MFADAKGHLTATHRMMTEAHQAADQTAEHQAAAQIAEHLAAEAADQMAEQREPCQVRQPV